MQIDYVKRKEPILVKREPWVYSLVLLQIIGDKLKRCYERFTCQIEKLAQFSIG
jgi:hypothetical protein